ncbi:MAG: flagellar basal-body rod protein FlgG [Gemmatimonadetes bacterium SCN 70-22]|nr:MAG: flagellar basal-body rod protein FlgG [Gemmatimonadetes bacterium SCN 70-22]
MNPALRTAASGMAAQQTRTEVIANNLANVNTTAFKRSRAQFTDLLYQNVQQMTVVGQPDAETRDAIQVGRGVRLVAVTRLETQGAMAQTGRALDVGIQGDGYFQVSLPDGSTAYTRDGNFGLSDKGLLVTNDGYQVVPGITFPDGATDVSISRTGIISATKDGQPIELGRIELARFINPAGLQGRGGSLYTATLSAGEPMTGYPDEQGMGALVTGMLETSNVEIVQEMVDMIEAQRAYQINSKAVQAADEMSQTTTQMVR